VAIVLLFVAASGALVWYNESAGIGRVVAGETSLRSVLGLLAGARNWPGYS
jgi:hypothetical protein